MSSEKSITLTGLRKGTSSTVGNFIRRMVLLSDSSLKVVAVKINSGRVESMFVPIDNVVQDSMDIINNLSQIKFEGDSEYSRAYVEIDNGTISAGHFANAESRVLNPELEILTTVGNANVSLEVIVRNNQGAVTSDKNKMDCLIKYGPEVEDFIYLDSYHSQATCHFTYETQADLTESLTINIKLEGGDADVVLRSIVMDIAIILKNLK